MLHRLAIALVAAVSLGVAAPTGAIAAHGGGGGGHGGGGGGHGGGAVMAEAAVRAADTASAQVPDFPGAECQAATRL
jgi:hypothetical protein